MGRETFLFPVSWETEREWWKEDKKTFPVMSPATGKIETRYPLPFPDQGQRSRGGFVDEFDRPALDRRWNFRRPPATPFHKIDPARGVLRIKLPPTAIAENEQYAFVGARQRDFHFHAETALNFAPASASEEAGLAVMQNDRAALTLTQRRERGQTVVVLSKWLYGERVDIAETSVAPGDIALQVEGDKLMHEFFVTDGAGQRKRVGDPVDIEFMSPAVLRGFNYTGLYVGLYASSNGVETSAYADFKYFSYSPRRSQ